MECKKNGQLRESSRTGEERIRLNKYEEKVKEGEGKKQNIFCCDREEEKFLTSQNKDKSGSRNFLLVFRQKEICES